MTKISWAERKRKLEEIHGGYYTYEYLEPDSYPLRHSDIVVVCPNHGEFTTNLHNHLKGKGCSQCATEKRARNRVEKAARDFATKAHTIHGERYDYSRVNYRGAHFKITIVCSDPVYLYS